MPIASGSLPPRALISRTNSCGTNDGEAGESLLDLLEDIEAERRRNKNAVGIAGALLGCELVCAVGGTDSDSKRVNTGAGDEFFNFLGTGVGGILGAYIYVVLYARELAQLALNDHAVSVSVFNYLFGKGNVVLEGVLGAVDHNGGEAAVDAGLADIEICAVVKVKSEVNAAVLYCSLGKTEQVCGLCIFACAGRDLKDDGGFFLSRRLGYRLDYFHVVDVERADGVTALICLPEHFRGLNICIFNAFLASRKMARRAAGWCI